MWCETQKNGSVKYCERYTDPLTDKVKKVTVTMPKDSPQNKNKAMRILAGKIEQLIKERDIIVRQNVTIKELCDAYVASLRLNNRKETTIYAINCQLNNLCSIVEKDAILDNISARYLNDTLAASKKKRCTLNGYIRIFKIALKWGYQNDYFQNYALMTKLTFLPEKDERATKSEQEYIKALYLEPEEINKLLKHMSDNNLWEFYYITDFLILTGLRIGELTALADTDVDLNNNVIHVTKTKHHKSSIPTTPKTPSSVRDVHIQPELATLIRKLRLWRKEELFARGVCSGLFLPNFHTGGYLTHGRFLKHLKRLSMECLGKDVTPHKLRHTHASLLAAAGMTPEQIARRLGHESSEITKQIYIHVTQKIVENDNRQLDTISIA